MKHLIFLYQKLASKERLAFKLSSEETLFPEDLPETIFELNAKYQLASHRIYSKDATSQSIEDQDSFFKGVHWFESVEAFKRAIEEDQKQNQLSPLDFSKYVLAKRPLDKLQIQKVLYLIYAAALMNDIHLFSESPLAYKYGPVFEDVYQAYKGKKSKQIIESHLSSQEIFHLLSSGVRPEIMQLTDEVLALVEGKTGSDLINLTHIPNSPWQQVYEPGANHEIDDETIRRYHPYERRALERC
ncbi:type II toxin-antitoxin system antitoxin SocA domain-containing protein [Aerococcus sp. UMB7834]|uniref:Panacea domain-containing protein n=1 Tax=Aerococcus sp. UMB7834 TaxID=3046342 RepID=UPI00255178EF|nr:type II toxin-antitoxin system antitoxin SocA domain-containing protein [Aerococcus sp. UMB7834]MDK6805118.1 DUF4065 domain-containing protein [Aerococcus sp. UMB7834]